jgi:hypothetical protein
MLTTLKRPVKRRIGNLVVQLSESGITIRGYRRHKGRDYTWEQVASLAMDDLPLVRAAEQAAGITVLAEVCGRRSKRKKATS